MKPIPTIEADGITRAGQLAAGVFDFCGQCYRRRPLSDFISPRGRFVVQCVACRRRYRNWVYRSEGERNAARRRVRRTGDGTTVHLVRASHNRKTGPIPVSTTDMRSCPDVCPHRDAGCYAGYGKAAWHWRNVPRNGLGWLAFCQKIETLPEGQLWRHNEAGDLPGLGDHVDVGALAALVEANRGRRGFTFTHSPVLPESPLPSFTRKGLSLVLESSELQASFSMVASGKRRGPPTVPANEPRRATRDAIAHANANGFTINLSADSLRHADELAALEIGPVAVVLPSDAPVKQTTPAGRTVIVCPAELGRVTCATCGLCAKPQRKAIIGFRAHGQAARRVSLRVLG